MLAAVIGLMSCLTGTCGTFAQQHEMPRALRAGVVLASKQANMGAKVAEIGMRRMAVVAPHPNYPGPPSKARSGVAVCLLHVGANGKVRSVEVLQAPDEEIATSLRRTLEQWTYAPPKIGPFSGKLTYYYKVVDGKGVVELPSTAAPVNGEPVRPLAGKTFRIDNLDLPEVSEGDMDSMKDAVLLDVRDRVGYSRRARPGSLNIPFDELVVRAPMELSLEDPLVIDCSYTPHSQCRMAAAILKSAGAKRVFVLNQ